MFDYYISLGPRCPIASSMSKYGLRSFSGLFDWLITPKFEWVLHYIETDFQDFLKMEDLERYDDYENHFRDKKTGFKFIHDVENFKNEYGKLKSKYDRRINRFLKAIKSNVCYLRAVRSKEEIEYIENNADYIKYVIHKHNPGSEILFLFDADMPVPEDFGFLYYTMAHIWSGTSHKNLRSYFDGAKDFLHFCASNYSSVNLMDNLAFDQKKEEEYQEKNISLLARRYQTLAALVSHDFSEDVIPGKVVIYGAGVIGTELYRKIKGLTSVMCFVDNEKAGGEFEGVKIIKPGELQCENGVKVIVSAAYDFDDIKKGLSVDFHREDIISIDEILRLKF